MTRMTLSSEDPRMTILLTVSGVMIGLNLE